MRTRTSFSKEETDFLVEAFCQRGCPMSVIAEEMSSLFGRVRTRSAVPGKIARLREAGVIKESEGGSYRREDIRLKRDIFVKYKESVYGLWNDEDYSLQMICDYINDHEDKTIALDYALRNHIRRERRRGVDFKHKRGRRKCTS